MQIEERGYSRGLDAADEWKEFRNSPERFRVNALGFSLRMPGLLEKQYRLIPIKGKRLLVDNVKLLFRTQTP